MKVFVYGGATAKFSRGLPHSAEELMHHAVVETLRSSDIARTMVDVAYVGSLYEPPGLGQRALKELGFAGIAIHNVENACSTGTDAFIHAVRAVASGEARAALAVGVDCPTRIAAHGLLPVTPGDPALTIGITAPSIYALRASRYLAASDSTADDLAAVAVKNRRHGSLNPAALFREPVDLATVLHSPMISEPLTRLQCCPVSDGAAAVLVAREGMGRTVARVDGWSMRSGTPQDVLTASDDITKRAAAAAYAMAGIEASEIDVCEVHDAFTIGELLALESLGICAAGEAGAYVRSGRANIGGRGVVVNPSGGLLSRGHPPGATGLAQIVELARQLDGECGERQIDRVRIAVSHTRGGGSFDLDANACGVTVLSDGKKRRT